MNTVTANKKVIGVVLAGGRSSRMGKDKALLKIQTQSMIARSKELLLNAGVEKVMISRNDGQSGHMSDIIANKGPLSGIHSAAMRYIDYDLLVLPVDLPLIETSDIKALITKGLSLQQNARYEGDNLPLFVHNTGTFRQVLDYTLGFANNFSVERLCTHFPLTELAPPSSQAMLNTNTPEQWQLAMHYIYANNIHTNNVHTNNTQHTMEHA